ncbi:MULTISPECIES: hypothetical protein [Bradyrhizobium]|uniref:hypothetical protein n=1 Tax=Bradyrhizobium elkanii TaxID=29448 RepID=UPI0012BBE6C5|nr:hypothetical protein [Bradyrhizobium elkanii]
MRDMFGALLLFRDAIAILNVLAICLGAGSAFAQGPYNDPNTAEGWALSQLKQGDTADFNKRCDTPVLDSEDENDSRWQDDCRKLSGRFLQDLLTQTPWREAISFVGVQINGARIVGDINLENAKLIRSISILNSRIEGHINLIRARTDSSISLEGSLMNNRLEADGLHSESDLLFNASVFKSGIDLNGAKTDGDIRFTGARLDGRLGASQVHIGGNLFLNSDQQNKASFNEVDISDAKVAAQVNMLGASFNGPLNAGLLKVGGNLFAPSSNQDKTKFRDVFLIGAEIMGQVSFVGARFDGTLAASLLQVGGTLYMGSDAQNKASFKEVNLTGSKVAGNVIMAGASLDGALEASLLQVGGTLSMASNAQNKASFKDISLTSAKVTGDISMIGASLAGKLNASSLEVNGSLSMQSADENQSSFNNVNLTGAVIKGQLNMSGASFDGELDAETMHVDGNLLMQFDRFKPSFKKVDLNGAKVAGNISMIGASLDGALVAGLLQVDGNLLMGSLFEYKSNFKAVFLPSAVIKGQFNMSGASFDRALNLISLQVGGDLIMTDARYSDEVDMSFARVGRDLDLRRAGLGNLDLSGASIAGALQLGGAHESADWKVSHETSGVLNLRNAHAGNLVDAEKGTWPAKGQLRLVGFTFGHLDESSGPETRRREVGLWDNWVRLDPRYSPTPYAQLAAAFTNSGDRDAAEDIRYLGRERQREAACKATWLRGSCFLQTVLGSVAGYGIGTYTFKVVPWVLLFWLAGASLLWWTVPAAKHNGAVWCLCASLAQLLPVITINKELTAFFDDPERARMKGWQVFAFSALGLVGLALGTILLVAISGLTHSA